MDIRTVGFATLCAHTQVALAAAPLPIVDNTPSWMLLGGPGGFGWESAILDANGDGFDDVVVGALGLGGWFGGAYLYEGSATGLETTATWVTHGDPGEALGLAVAGAGDVNGDDFEDLLLSGSAWSGGTGRVRLFQGSESGLQSTEALLLEGATAGGTYGSAMAGIGDANGDGYGEIAIGAEYGDLVEVFEGASSGMSSTAAVTLEGEKGSFFGHSVAGAGDVNGDGYADLIVGAFYEDGFLHDTTLAGEPDEYLGLDVDGGDVDGDGRTDVIVGSEASVVRVFENNGTGVDTTASTELFEAAPYTINPG